MKYKVINQHDYGKRDAALLKHEDNTRKLNARGLFPEEKVVEVDGEEVAVRLEPEWMDNNDGICLHAYARWLNKDGSTKEDARGNPIQTSHSAVFDHLVLEDYGLPKIQDALVALVLGEEQPTIKLDGGTSEPVINVPENTIKSASIKAAISTVKKLEKFKLNL